jgi:Ser/Thr protein kinase RdoA (MazF antagonist)
MPSVDDRHTPRSLQTHLSRLERGGISIGAERPDLAPALAQITNAVRAGLGQPSLAPIHGDLKPDHIYVDRDTIFIIDFDDLHMSDPMLDVANMEMDLARLQSDVVSGTDHEDNVARAFVEGYFAYAPEVWRARLPLYRAIARVSDAARLKSGHDQRGRDQIGTLVREAHAAVST